MEAKVNEAEKKQQKKTQKRGLAMHGCLLSPVRCSGRSGAEERDQSPFGPILAPVTSSMTQMTWMYKF